MKANTDRIRLLDILRGFAILGTLGTNIWIFAYLGDLNAVFTFNRHDWWSIADEFVRVFVLFLVNGKLLGLLTIMFGVGLAMKYEQALRRGNAWPGVYIWTSLILMAEGFMHYTLVMEYDILMSYGLTAMITAFIVKGGERVMRRAMMVVGGFHGAIMLLITGLGLYYWAIDFRMTIGDMNEVIALYRDGSWLQQVGYRWSDFLLLRFESMFVIPMNTFLFLLGVRMWRAGYFAPDEAGKRKRGMLLRVGLFAGIPLNLLLFVPGGYMDLSVRYFFAPLLSLGYLGLIAKCVEASGKLWVWSKLERIGRMSLSCYVLQNLIASCLFYGWGFGLGGKVNALTIVGIWLLIGLVQAVFASLWLRRFQYGPMESARKFTSGLFMRS